MPVISIIVPVYNVEKYLRRCLDSVLAQTFTVYGTIWLDRYIPILYSISKERFYGSFNDKYFFSGRFVTSN
jgi:cellulose synthase/poly-beta-1,6-N-acetylglucosamine synthase-like glycosyltransferase